MITTNLKIYRILTTLLQLVISLGAIPAGLMFCLAPDGHLE
ncbi:MAG: hypothetical protein NTU98_15270 [Bacteroidetes bacterium]|nr:hypothetical protein [Bacteroidota bacterium]